MARLACPEFCARALGQWGGCLGSETWEQMLQGTASCGIPEKHPSGAKQAAEKTRITGKSLKKHPSGAKARRLLSSICGTTEVVPFQNSPLMGVFPQPGKPVLILKTLMARLKPCPFKNIASTVVFPQPLKQPLEPCPLKAWRLSGRGESFKQSRMIAPAGGSLVRRFAHARYSSFWIVVSSGSLIWNWSSFRSMFSSTFSTERITWNSSSGRLMVTLPGYLLLP